MSRLVREALSIADTSDRAAFRGLGHVLAISRGLSTFKHPDAPEEDDMSLSSDGNAGNSSSSAEPGLRWSGNVGNDLRREERCLFDSVGSVCTVGWLELFYS